VDVHVGHQRFRDSFRRTRSSGNTTQPLSARASLRKMAEDAPLSSLLLAFLLGVWVRMLTLLRVPC
jgi:hypothetical protein